MGFLKNLVKGVGKVGGDLLKAAGNTVLAPVEQLTGKNIVPDNYKTGFGRTVGTVGSTVGNLGTKVIGSFLPGVGNVLTKATEIKAQLPANLLQNSSQPQPTSRPVEVPAVVPAASTKGATPAAALPLASQFTTEIKEVIKQTEKTMEYDARDKNRDGKVSTTEKIGYWVKIHPIRFWGILVAIVVTIGTGVYLIFFNKKRSGYARRRY